MAGKSSGCTPVTFSRPWSVNRTVIKSLEVKSQGGGRGCGMRDIDIVLGEKGGKPSGKVSKISPIQPTFMCPVWFFAQFLLASNG